MLTALIFGVVLSSSAPTSDDYSPQVLQVFGDTSLSAEERIRRLTEIANAGDASAWQKLGTLIDRSEDKSPAARLRMCDMFERGAEQRRQAMANLATCYFKGDGRPRDLAKAEALYRSAMVAGLPEAQCGLGVVLMADNEPVRRAEGAELCRKSAESEDGYAQMVYGRYLLNTLHDPVAARQMLSKAVTRGEPDAAFALGVIYWNGEGTPKNPALAARAWKVAFDGGRRDAAALLAKVEVSYLANVKSFRDIESYRFDAAMYWLGIAASEAKSPDEKRFAEDQLDALRQFRAQR